MPIVGDTPNSASRRPFSPTICVRTVLCLKCDLNSILFLLTPAESEEKLARLVAMLAQFERHIEDDTPLADVLPTVFQKYPVRYRDYTLRELCQEMHNLYVSFDVKDLQKAMFRKESLPHVAMNPQDANSAFIRGDVELVRISEAGGRIAAEGALPYPPGVLCVVPGEIWGGAAQRYFGAGRGHQSVAWFFAGIAGGI